MRTYVEEFLTEYGYRKKDCEILLQNYDAVCKNTEAYAVWESLIEAYDKDMHFDINASIDRVVALAEPLKTHAYTLTLLYLICQSRRTRAYYEEKDIDLEIYRNSMYDLYYKNEECREVYGICGTFVGKWFFRFYDLTRFALGRLQFELTELKTDYEKNGVKLPAGAKVINVHIPRTGTPLDRASCDAAFAQAASFFQKELGESPTVFVCHSWLLFSAHRNMLKPNSSIISFMDRFYLLESGEYEDYNELWRIFDRRYNGDPDTLGRNSSLHRAYADRVKAGEQTGWGYGAYLYQ
jgi:hypothetical protein